MWNSQSKKLRKDDKATNLMIWKKTKLNFYHFVDKFSKTIEKLTFNIIKKQ